MVRRMDEPPSFAAIATPVAGSLRDLMTSPAMFFALSTGRSGTQTLAHVLTQSPGCLCLHEPHPQLVRESVLFREGRLSQADAIDLLRRTRPHPAADRAYGESNNRLSLMVPALAAAFPEAKFIWLQRDARDVVASELQRGGYAPAVAAAVASLQVGPLAAPRRPGRCGDDTGIGLLDPPGEACLAMGLDPSTDPPGPRGAGVRPLPSPAARASDWSRTFLPWHLG